MTFGANKKPPLKSGGFSIYNMYAPNTFVARASSYSLIIIVAVNYRDIEKAFCKCYDTDRNGTDSNLYKGNMI